MDNTVIDLKTSKLKQGNHLAVDKTWVFLEPWKEAQKFLLRALPSVSAWD